MEIVSTWNWLTIIIYTSLSLVICGFLIALWRLKWFSHHYQIVNYQVAKNHYLSNLWTFAWIAFVIEVIWFLMWLINIYHNYHQSIAKSVGLTLVLIICHWEFSFVSAIRSKYAYDCDVESGLEDYLQARQFKKYLKENLIMEWYQIHQQDVGVKNGKKLQNQLDQLTIGKEIQNHLSPIYDFKFVALDQVIVNENEIVNIDDLISGLKTHWKQLSDFVANLNENATIELSFDWNWLWRGKCRFSSQWELKTHLGNYQINALLNFDAREDLVVKSDLIKNYFNYVINQCDHLLKLNNLNLWADQEQPYQIRVDCGTIIRDHDNESDWSYHDGFCWDFDEPVLNLTDGQGKVLKAYDNCHNSLNCQIIALVKDLIAIKQGTKIVQNNGEIN